MAEKKVPLIPEEVLINKIFLFRGQKVMIDNDLAELYGVGTKRINEQVKRNRERFPDDFMFQLSENEFNNLKSQNATSSWGGRRTLPYAFTEHGVLMLSSVLNSEIAIKVNIQIVRVYTKIRKMIASERDFLAKFDKIELKLADHDKKIILLFEYLKSLESSKKQDPGNRSVPKIGYKQKKSQ